MRGKCGSAWSRLVRSELVGFEAERAGTLGGGEILVQFCGGESRDFFAVERSHHRTISVLSLPLFFSWTRNRCIAERKSTDNGQEISIFVYQFGSLAFERLDGRLELGYLL